MSPEMLSAIAALLSVVAGTAAVLAAWFGPMAAARVAERMREEALRRDETHRLRLRIFMILMQERATYHTGEGVRALNLIDAAFADQFDVREAWARLLESLQLSSHASDLERKDRMRELLQRMADALGLCGRLGLSDLDRIYVPEGPPMRQLHLGLTGVPAFG